MSRIFISYRREDSEGYAGRVFDRLSAHFGRDALFMDIDTIPPGEDFVEFIERHVQACDVVIALIGQRWLKSKKGRRRRLDDPEDFVRLELAAAIKRKIPIIPTLVAGAPMPGKQDLPDQLVPFTRRQALEMSSKRFHHDVDRLIKALERIVGPAEAPAPDGEQPTPTEAGAVFQDTLKDGSQAPEMVAIPAGEFQMGDIQGSGDDEE